MRVNWIAEPLDGDDFSPDDAVQRSRAAIFRPAVDQHHAAAALLGATAKPRAEKLEIVTQDVEQRCFTGHIQRNLGAVEVENSH